MVKKKKGRRRLRKEIRYALYIILVLAICSFAYKLFSGSLFWGVKSINDNAASYRQKSCLVFYPKNSSSAKEKAKMMCDGINERTIIDYAKTIKGDYYEVSYENGTTYLLNKDDSDFIFPDNKRDGDSNILRDYLFYSLKKDKRKEALDPSTYENTDLSYHFKSLNKDEAIINFTKYDIDVSMPLSYLEKATGINFGASDVAYPKPRYVDPNQKYICLTFDDGPRLETSEKIINLLEKYNANATFFILGNRLGEKQLALIKESVSKGNEYGSHTQSHADLTKLDTAEMIEEVKIPYNDLKNYFGYEMKLFRPPYGAFYPSMEETVGMTAVLWNVDSLDWRIRDKQGIIDNVIPQLRDDTLILFHDIVEATADAMETLIPYWISEGYQIITVSEMLARH